MIGSLVLGLTVSSPIFHSRDEILNTKLLIPYCVIVTSDTSIKYINHKVLLACGGYAGRRILAGFTRR
jgi:hypothetical protein